MQVIHLRARHTEYLADFVRRIDFVDTIKHSKTIKETEFDYYVLTGETRALVENAIQQCFDCEIEFSTIRLHRTFAHKQIGPHVDDGFPGYNTLAIRLDEGDPRLIVGDELRDERVGRGYCIPEGTVHSVKTGKSDRYSLVAWYREVN